MSMNMNKKVPFGGFLYHNFRCSVSNYIAWLGAVVGKDGFKGKHIFMEAIAPAHAGEGFSC
jgi:hypothetical protein